MESGLAPRRGELDLALNNAAVASSLEGRLISWGELPE
jgi:hypothetical protein